MTQERIQFFENLLSKPMAEPHRGWIEELLDAVKGKPANMLHTDKRGKKTDLGTVKPDSIRIQGKPATIEEASELLSPA